MKEKVKKSSPKAASRKAEKQDAKPLRKAPVSKVKKAAAPQPKKIAKKTVREPVISSAPLQPVVPPVAVTTAPKTKISEKTRVAASVVVAPVIDTRPKIKEKVSAPPVEKATPKEPPLPQVKVEQPVKKVQEAKVQPEQPAVQAKVVPEATESPAVKEPKLKELELKTPITVKELSIVMGVKANQLIGYLIEKGALATINQNLGEDMIKGILPDFGFAYKEQASEKALAVEHDREEKEEKHLVTRSPVVTFMGHVDHGKTSLLDSIRKTRVADKEKGGITQHIGAYMVKFKGGSVTFLDTPGHEAFTAMRARGANATDVVVLVVAADDGVMPQTKEAIDHARVADVTIVVAINKCDLPGANIDRVKRQLSELNLVAEDWGGKTIMVPVSAKTGAGVDTLLEMLLLESELLELKANPKIRARGVVIEGKLSSGEGPVATVLVKNGTLRRGDVAVSGVHYGRIKAMVNDRGERVEEALPSWPVSVLGLSGVPIAGDEFFVVKDEKKAKTIATLKQNEEQERRFRRSNRVTLEGFYNQVRERGIKELKIVLKADVQGSIEALYRSLQGMDTKDVRVDLIHAGVGNISDSDVLLALASNAVIIGFNVKIDPKAEETAKKEDIDIKIYGIIYDAIADVKAAMEGLLEPFSKEVFVGRAQVRQVFMVSKIGTVAGCFVVKGKIVRSGIARLVRNKAVVFEGKIASLKRFKDDVREVAEDFECGLAFDGHNDIKDGDTIEIYQIEKVARRLDAKK